MTEEETTLVEPRLTSGFWVKAYIRTCQTAGLTTYVLRKGAGEGGAIFVRLALMDGTAQVLAPFTGDDGDRSGYLATGETPVTEAAADEFLARQASFDDDHWVIEVENKDGFHLLEERLVTVPGG